MEEQDQSSVAKRALLELRRLRAKVAELEQERSEPIAIVGLGCRFPGAADTPERYWQLLHGGQLGITEIPPDRWDVDALYSEDPAAPGTINTRVGGFIDGVDQFDPEPFRLSPGEVELMDPQHRILLETSWQALENAGYAPASLSEQDVGVFVGVMTDDYQQAIYRDLRPEQLTAAAMTGNGHSLLGGRVSYTLGLQGPALTVETACSSALVAVHLACQSLRARECDAALAAGVHLILDPTLHIMLSRTRTFSSSDRCLTFDAAADGLVSSEGCGVVVLKRLSDAKAAGDSVLALLLGSAVNHDGPSSGLTAPNWYAQQKVIGRALSAADLDQQRVSYVEAHGVGTELGDPIEARAVGRVIRDKRPREGRLALGSAKTNVGHLGPAAGVAGLIKVVLALQHEQIPAHLHLTAVNPHIDAEGIPLVVPTAATPWPSVGEPRVAGVSSFGLSGTNAHVVVGEAPAQDPEPVEGDRDHHLLCVSGRSEQELQELARAHAGWIDQHPHAAWPDACFTANVGRRHPEHRLAVVAPSASAVDDRLRAAAGGADQAGAGTGDGARLDVARRVLAKLDPDHILERVDDFTEEELDFVIDLVNAD